MSFAVHEWKDEGQIFAIRLVSIVVLYHYIYLSFLSDHYAQYVGLELTTPRSRTTCSTNWASWVPRYTTILKVRVLVCYWKDIYIMLIIAGVQLPLMVILWYSNGHCKCLLIFNLCCYKSNMWPIRLKKNTEKQRDNHPWLLIVIRMFTKMFNPINGNLSVMFSFSIPRHLFFSIPHLMDSI